MLAYANPLDLLTGQRIDPRRSLSWGNDKEFHHFFPRGYLKRQEVPAGRANAVANIVMLGSASNIKISSRPPSEYLGQVVAEIGREALVARLKTLLVSEKALDAALADDYETFLAIRSATLQGEALALVGERMADSVSFSVAADQASEINASTRADVIELPEGELLTSDAVADDEGTSIQLEGSNLG